MFYSNYKIPSILAFLLLVGCLHKKEEQKNYVLETFDKSDINVIGFWKSNCSYFTNDESYQVRGITFSENEYVFQRSRFMDSSCSIQDSTLIELGDYTLGDIVTLISGDSAIELNRQPIKYHLTPNSDEIRNTYNNNSYCGHSEWQTDLPYAFESCDQYGIKIIYDLLKPESNRLLLGVLSSGNGLSASDRPTQMELIYYYNY